MISPLKTYLRPQATRSIAGSVAAIARRSRFPCTKDSTQQLVGKLRRYNKGIEDFREKDTQIKLPDSTILPAERIVPLKLERLSGSKFPDVFNMMYTPPHDDISEEEAINRAPTTTFGVNAPGASLSFIEVISQSN
jgi:hypothetical protein